MSIHKQDAENTADQSNAVGKTKSSTQTSGKSGNVHPSTIQTRQGSKPPIQAKQKPIQAKSSQKGAIQAKQKPLQTKASQKAPIQANLTKSMRSSGTQSTQDSLKEDMGNQYNVDLSSYKEHPNSSFPDKVNAEATIQGKDIHYGPGKFTLENRKHEFGHAIDNTLNGTPKADTSVNGMPVDTSREAKADEIMNTPLQAKVKGGEKLASPVSSNAVQRKIKSRNDEDTGTDYDASKANKFESIPLLKQMMESDINFLISGEGIIEAIEYYLDQANNANVVDNQQNDNASDNEMSDDEDDDGNIEEALEQLNDAYFLLPGVHLIGESHVDDKGNRNEDFDNFNNQFYGDDGATAVSEYFGTSEHMNSTEQYDKGDENRIHLPLEDNLTRLGNSFSLHLDASSIVMSYINKKKLNAKQWEGLHDALEILDNYEGKHIALIEAFLGSDKESVKNFKFDKNGNYQKMVKEMGTVARTSLIFAKRALDAIKVDQK
ncbi:MAG TPA: hypothetical protein DCS93_02895, partial [Microscillaceae bacterium]|nr:hypothetical protein [Microscillaceae bacterium]